MQSNVGGGGAALVQADPNRELAVFDALPPRWRELVRSLPINQSLDSIQRYRAVLGDEAAYETVVRTFRQKFVGWSLGEPPRRSRRRRYR